MGRLSDNFLRRDKIQTATAEYTLHGMTFVLKSSMNKEYREAVKNGPSKNEGDYYNDCVAKYLLVSWRDVADDDGKELPATEKNRIEALRKYTELATRLLEFSANPQNFIASNYDAEKDAVEEELEN